MISDYMPNTSIELFYQNNSIPIYMHFFNIILKFYCTTSHDSIRCSSEYFMLFSPEYILSAS